MGRIRRGYAAVDHLILRLGLVLLLSLGLGGGGGGTKEDGPKAQLEDSALLGGIEIASPSPAGRGALPVQLGKVHGQDGRLGGASVATTGTSGCIGTARVRPRLLGRPAGGAAGRALGLAAAATTAAATAATTSASLAALARHNDHCFEGKPFLFTALCFRAYELAYSYQLCPQSEREETRR